MRLRDYDYLLCFSVLSGMTRTGTIKQIKKVISDNNIHKSNYKILSTKLRGIHEHYIHIGINDVANMTILFMHFGDQMKVVDNENNR